MAATRGSGALQSFKIARGALVDFRSLMWKLLLGIAIWLGGFVALVATYGPAMKGFIALGPVGLLAMVLSLVVYLNLPGRLHLGADGVLVDWRNEQRFVPFSEIGDAPPYAEDVMGKRMIGVELRLRDGQSLKLPIGEDQFGADERVRTLSIAIRAAIEKYRKIEAVDDAGFLARGERSKDEWLSRLRGFGEGANAGPREAPIPVDRLWRIVEDPSAGVTSRAGAAVALSRALDTAGKERLRIAAEASAAPHLRVAIEAAATGDEEAVSEALDKLEGAPGQTPASPAEAHLPVAPGARRD